MTEKQIDELISKMSLEEKAAQLSQQDCHVFIKDDLIVTGVDSENGISSENLKKISSVLNISKAENRRAVTEKHCADYEIPLIFMLDVIHGFKTIFPIPLALASSFDEQLVEDCAKAAGEEAKYAGIDCTFSPMVDLARDARWGRVMESSGEDPYLNGLMGRAYIRGYHKAGVPACVKHFAAYGAAEAGRDYNVTDISEYCLREFYLRSYGECMKEKPEMVMSSFNTLNGKPILAHKNIIIDILRDEWGFDGVLISDYNSVEQMIEQSYCPDRKACAEVALNAELDMEMSSTCYIDYLPELVKEGKIKQEHIDKMVKRVLTLKNKCGLFEKPEGQTDEVRRDEITLSKNMRDLARKAANESIVLLKNDGVLPLSKDANAAFIGPFADNKYIIGNWLAMGDVNDAVTIKESVEKLTGKSVICAQGSGDRLYDRDESRIAEAVEKAKNADIIVACVGESMWDTGEARSRATITLPQPEITLIKELKKLNKKLVLVVFAGRPLALTETDPLADAIVYAWQPGTEGGNAVADVLYGEVNPSAKITMSFPRSVGQCPIYYNRLPTGRNKPDDNAEHMFTSMYIDELNAPLYPFGYGLSYTRFSYGEIRLSSEKLKSGEKITARITVSNTGERDGQETVQLYIRDKFASNVRPMKEMKAFKKVNIPAGDSREITFDIDESMLEFFTENRKFEAEAGEFEVFIGTNSRDVKSAKFELIK